MPRSLRALILLLVLLWQSMAMLGPVRLAQQVGEIEHLVVHGQDSSHHHHSDHALHMDDVNDVAVQHIHADSGTNTAGAFKSVGRRIKPPWLSNSQPTGG